MAVIYKQTVENLSERRIDAWHYHPNFQNQIDKIKQNIGVIFLNDVIDKFRGVASGATPLGANYLQNGKVKFYRTSEVEGMILDSEKAVYISKEDDEKLARSRLKAGDILLTITGAKFGKSAVVSELHLPGNISQHSVRFHPKPELIDSYFLVAYLESNIGQDVIWREAYGATRPAIDFPSVRALTIPKVNLIAQKYIGDKVRQAELLRQFAKFKQLRIESIFNKKVLDLGYKYKAPTKYIRCNLDNRLDPAYYAATYSFLDEEWFRNASQKLKSYIDNGSYGVLPSSNSYGLGTEKFIRATDLSSANINSKSYTLVPFEEVSAKAKVSTGDILLEIKGAISECQLSTHYLDGTYVNGSIYRFKPKDIDAAYLTFYLRSFIKKLYCDRVSVNNIISYLDLESIHNLPILRLDSEIENIISDEFLLIELANRLSFRATKTAKYLVEALIEGVITEEELIQAQNALEQGDASLDRAILSQMTEDGYAVAGSKPLFSDLDEFYDLLEQAKALE